MQTEGEWRVGVDFNPSDLSDVYKVKSMAAEFIDFILKEGVCVDSRTQAIAATKMEEACMWAVKSITKPDIDNA